MVLLLEDRKLRTWEGFYFRMALVTMEKML